MFPARYHAPFSPGVSHFKRMPWNGDEHQLPFKVLSDVSQASEFEFSAMWDVSARILHSCVYVRIQNVSLSAIHRILMVRTTGCVEDSCTDRPYVCSYGSCELRVSINSRLQI